MSKYSCVRRVVTCVLFLAVVSTGLAQAGFFGIRAEGFSFCSASTYCMAVRQCFDQALEIDGWCSIHCSSGMVEGGPYCQRIDSSNEPSSSGGSSWWWEGGDVTVGEVDIRFSVSSAPGQLDLVIVSHLDDPTAYSEIAVFRFAGNPIVFQDLEVVSVSELVDLGIIAPDDVLYVKNDFPVGTSEFHPQVSTAGIPEEEVVVFYGGDGDGNPECDTFEECPATSGIGLLALVAVLVTLASRLVHRHRRCA